MTGWTHIRGEGGRRVYRSMKEDGGRPAVGASASTLGVRDVDIPTRPDGSVAPGTGGMSVTPDDPRELPQYRRPRALGGTGRHPVWWTELAPDDAPVSFRQDDDFHGLVEPSAVMQGAIYVAALHATVSSWEML